MNIYAGLNIYRVVLFKLYINLDQFSVILIISLNVVICVTDIRRMNGLIYNVQFGI